MSRPDPAAGDGSGAPVLTAVRARAARLMRMEAGWPDLLPAIAACCAFAVLAELALPQRLPLWLHGALLLLLAAFVAERVWRAVRHTSWPDPATVDRRIEQRSGLRHHPLQILADRPATHLGDLPAATEAIWRAHRARTMASLGALRAGGPRLGLWPHRSGRVVLALLAVLAVSGIMAGQAAVDRLASGFLPGVFELPGPLPWMQAWITPPDYARAAPVFLTDPRGETTMPFGSVLQVNLTGVEGAPSLSARSLDPAQRSVASSPHFTRLAAGSWSLTWTVPATAPAGLRLALRANGRGLAEWRLRVTPLPPTLVAWDRAPGAASDALRTRLPWHVANPFGLNRLTAEIGLAGARGDRVLAPLRVAIPLAPGSREARGVATPDLSADPRAGEAVVGHLVATDSQGHDTAGAAARFTLPERRFRNPLARAVLDTRKRLALGRENRGDAAGDLDALGGAPGQFASDSGMFLNLASIVSLLRNDDAQDEAAIDEATGRLWELALELEDGLHNDRAGTRANADLRAARDAVAAQLERMRALGDKGQSDKEQSELERRIQALSKAIARRMQALAEQARREHTVLPPMPDAKMLNGDALARMMQQMRDEAAHGNAPDAMRRLAQMQSMLDHMRAATPSDLQNAQAQAQAQRAAREQIEGLRDLVHRQSSLLDQSQARRNAVRKAERAQAPPGLDPQTAELLRRLGIPPSETDAAPSAGDETPAVPGDMPPGSVEKQTRSDAKAGEKDDNKKGDLDRLQAAQKQRANERSGQRASEARMQHGLSRALDELGQEFLELSGKRPGGFDAAGHDMDSARKALASGQDQAAMEAQQQALADLQKGATQMRQMMASTGGSPMLMPGMAEGNGGGSPGDDPGQEQGEDDHPGPSDPLGRPVATGPHDLDGETHVPDKIDQMRAREIEQELRRRDTDRTRPADELNYLDRLLKPF